MTSLVIGHVTHDSAVLWVRGERGYPFVTLTLTEAAGGQRPIVERKLESGCDYTCGILVTDLHPSAAYSVSASFRRRWWLALFGPKALTAPTGRFTTAPNAERSPSGAVPGAPLSFLLGSCNMSNIKINNLMGLLAGAAGIVAAARTLERIDNSVSTEFFLKAWLKKTLSGATRLVGGLFWRLTQFRQPGPPLIVSPFLRLASMMGTVRIAVSDRRATPAVGATLVSQAGAVGIMAFEPEEDEPDIFELVHIFGPPFQAGDELHLGNLSAVGRIETGSSIGGIATVDVRTPQRRPEFMLHLGDQIYFDFPEPESPATESYRRAYRETWSEDRLARHFLAQCPQYMTLDDHEILNNYSRDITLRNEDGYTVTDPQAYAEAALQAYREYVHCRQPSRDSVGSSSPCDRCGSTPAERAQRPAYYYAFDHGPGTHFFVMDTRTERSAKVHDGAPAQMISCCQMHDLKSWLSRHAKDLVFVVSSVPFVPEVHRQSDEGSMLEKRPVSKSIDKWCAPAFAAQRAEITRHILEHQVSKAVFLTGDVHCCYHASMRVAYSRRREQLHPIVIHELAAGPIYQLRLGRAGDFYEQFRGYFVSERESEPNLEYVSRMHRFFSLANAVLQVDVEPERSEPIMGAKGQQEKTAATQNLRWSVLETIASPSLHPRNEKADVGGAVMSGKISFFDCR